MRKDEVRANLKSVQLQLGQLQATYDAALKLGVQIEIPSQTHIDKDKEKLSFVLDALNQYQELSEDDLKRLNNRIKEVNTRVKTNLNTVSKIISKQNVDLNDIILAEKKREYNALIQEIPKHFSAKYEFASMYLEDRALFNDVDALGNDVQNYTSLLNKYRNLNDASSLADYAKAIKELNNFKIKHATLEEKAKTRYAFLQTIYNAYQAKMETKKSHIEKAREVIQRASIYGEEADIKLLIEQYSNLVALIDKNDYLSPNKKDFIERYERLSKEREKDLDKLTKWTEKFEARLDKKENSPEFKQYLTAIQHKNILLKAGKDALDEELKNLPEFKNSLTSLNNKINEISAKQYAIKLGQKNVPFEQRVKAVTKECLKDAEELGILTSALQAQTQNYLINLRQLESRTNAKIEEITTHIHEQMVSFNAFFDQINGKLKGNGEKTDSIEKIAQKFKDEFNKSDDVGTLELKLSFLSKKLENLQKIRMELDAECIKKEAQLCLNSLSKELKNILGKVKNSRDEVNKNIKEGNFAFNAKEEQLYSDFNSLKIAPDNYKDIQSSDLLKAVREEAKEKEKEFDALHAKMKSLIQFHEKVKILSNSGDFSKVIAVINNEDDHNKSVKLLKACSQYRSLLEDIKSNENLLSLEQNGRIAMKKYLEKYHDEKDIIESIEFIDVLRENGVNPGTFISDKAVRDTFKILKKHDFLKEFIKEEILSDKLFCQLITILDEKEIEITKNLCDLLADEDQQKLIYHIYLQHKDEGKAMFQYWLNLAVKANKQQAQSINLIKETAPELVKPWLFILPFDETIILNDYQKVARERLLNLLNDPKKIGLNIPFLDFLFNADTDRVMDGYIAQLNNYHQNESKVSVKELELVRQIDFSNHLATKRHAILPEKLKRDGFIRVVSNLNDENSVNEKELVFISKVLEGINGITKDQVDRDAKQDMEKFRAEAVAILLNTHSKVNLEMKKGLLINKANEMFPPTGFGAKLLDAIKCCIISVYTAIFSEPGKEYQFRFFAREETYGRKVVKQILDEAAGENQGLPDKAKSPEPEEAGEEEPLMEELPLGNAL